ncbi:nodulation protein NodZ [Mucisphaera sp.]|uniref:nodulation protein NodZ n=1 Tax=Mucisphaera sp. TaxID=2913024 RepID=UPI003D0E4E3C
MKQHYIMARSPNCGIGDHLSTVLGTWHYAKQTGRTLLIDWRGSRFNQRPGHNCFFDYFQTTDHIGNVPVIADDFVIDHALEGPWYDAKWTPENITATQHVPHTEEEILAIHRMILQTEPRPEPTIIVNQHLTLPQNPEVIKHALADIQFHPRYQEAALRIHEEQAPGSALIGIHIRHGNGENIGGRVAYWLDGLDLFRQLRRNRKKSIHQKQNTGRFLDNMPPCLTAVRSNTKTERYLYKQIRQIFTRLAGQLDTPAKPLLLTDAPQVVEGLSRELPDLIRFDSNLLPAGLGPLHQIDSRSHLVKNTQTTTDDMFTELALLRRCQAVVCIPSQFTLLTRNELPTHQTVSLQTTLINRAITKLAYKFPF